MIDGNALGDFLRSRRAKVSPAAVGLRGGSRRRVAGLRREELAQLAGISVEYYQRLEQGRATRPSDEVLDAIADILSLSDVEHAHLHRLAAPCRLRRDADGRDVDGRDADGRDTDSRHTDGTQAPSIRPELARLLALMDQVPAVAIDDLFTVLVMNEPARALFPDVAAMPDDRRNLARFLFQTRAGRDFYAEWDEIAAATVAQLRWTAGRFPHDTAVEAFIAELSDAPGFRRLWDGGDVEVRTHGAKTIRHPTRGVLRLDYENFELPGGQRQRVVAFTTGPRSPS